MSRFWSRAVVVLFFVAFVGLSFLRLLPHSLLGYALTAGGLAVTAASPWL